MLELPDRGVVSVEAGDTDVLKAEPVVLSDTLGGDGGGGQRHEPW